MSDQEHEWKKTNYTDLMKVIENRQNERTSAEVQGPIEKTEAPKSKQIPYANRICPFLSTPEKDMNCTARCKLYRDQKDGYNCPIPEIFAISYKLGVCKKKK